MLIRRRHVNHALLERRRVGRRHDTQACGRMQHGGQYVRWRLCVHVNDDTNGGGEIRGQLYDDISDGVQTPGEGADHDYSTQTAQPATSTPMLFLYFFVR